MSESNHVLRYLAIAAKGEEAGEQLAFNGATGRLSVVRQYPLDTAGTTCSLSQRQDLKTLLECSICLEIFEDPRTLQCLHSFCKKCLENFVDGKHEDDLHCPVCRYKFTLNKAGVAGMVRNHFICNMIEVLSIQHQDKSIPCSHCQQPSVGRCVTCELFMCEKCFKAHNDYPGFQDHLVLTMEELSKPENRSKIKKISKCPKHPKKTLKYYCDTCDQLICRHCMDFDHNKEHKFLPLDQAAENKRKDLNENSEVLKRTVADGNRKMQVLKEDHKLLKRNYDKAKCAINERKEWFFKRFQETLEKKTGSMMEEARQVFDRKTKQVEDKINETEAFVNRMKASANMAHSLLENGNDEEIVRSFQSLQNNLDTAKEEIPENTSNDVGVLPWNSNEIDKMLLAEIKDRFQLKENMNSVTDKNKLCGYPKLDDDDDDDVKSIPNLVTKPSFKGVLSS